MKERFNGDDMKLYGEDGSIYELIGVGCGSSGSKKENYGILGFVIVGIIARLLFGKVALIVYLAVLGIIFLKAVLSFVLQGAIGLGSVVVGYLIAGIMGAVIGLVIGCCLMNKVKEWIEDVLY